MFQVASLHAQKKNKKKESNQTKEQVISFDEATIIKAERLFFEGQQAKLIGDLDEAYEKFLAASKLYAHLDAAFYELAQLKQLANDFEGAENSMLKALEVSPDNVWYLRYLGDLKASQFKYDEAAMVFHDLRIAYPQEYDYYFQEAYYLIMLNELKAAIEVYDEVEAAIGVQADASLQKHKIYIRLNKIDEAVAELTKLINTYPDEMDFRVELADFYLINGQNEEAVKVLETILSIDENNVYALTSLADYYRTMGESGKALQYSEKAFANPDIPLDAKISVLYNYIKYFEQRKDQISDAYLLSNILVETHPKEAKAYAIAGDLRYLNNEAEKALPFYYRSLELQHDIFTVWQQVFFINSELAQYDDLVKKTDQAKEYFPNQALVYFFNGLGHQQLKHFSDAEKAYQRAVKMSADNKELKAQLYSNLGDVYNELGLFSESDEFFDKALALNPENAYVLNNYSYYLSLRGDKLEKAAQMSLLSNKLEPGNSSFLDTYAWVLFKSGEYEEAKEWQLRAIDAAENPSATLLEHLGDILFKLGLKYEALNKWKEAAEKNGGSEKLTKKIADKAFYE